MVVKHEITNNKKQNEKKTVPSTPPSITPRLPVKHKTANNKIKEKKPVPSTQPSIPPGIVTEILSWLPVKSLLRLKCVCKQWYAIIQDHHFIKKHMSRVRVIVATNQYNEIVEKCAVGSFKFICGCDGFLLRKNNASDKDFIKNPTTRQILELPGPHKGSFDISLSSISSTGDYKLVSIYNIDGKKAGTEGCEVLTVGTDDSWRPLKVPNLHDLNRKSDSFSNTIGPTVHYIRLTSDGSNIYQEVVSLDVETECFTVTAFSRDLLPDWKNVQALSWSGKLSFVDIVQEVLHVLVLEDHKRHRWGAKFVISLAFLKGNQEMMVDLVPLLIMVICGFGGKRKFFLLITFTVGQSATQYSLLQDIDCKEILSLSTQPGNFKRNAIRKGTATKAAAKLGAGYLHRYSIYSSRK